MTTKRPQAEDAARTLLKSQTKKNLIKSKTVSKDRIELTVEVRLLESTAQLVNNLLTIDGVSYATLVSYNGEYTAEGNCGATMIQSKRLTLFVALVMPISVAFCCLLAVLPTAYSATGQPTPP